ncbi:P-loop containing nucleoside triphosphate hydrolase protein [Chytridium lagenaria]|nr:P-loop containing nucleoside triphosphate hydrolase protein [Chytridium lagenaria]
MAHALLMPGSPLLEAAMHMLMESPMFMSGGNSSFNSYGSAHEHSGYQCGASSEAFRPTHFLLKNDIFGAGVGLMLVSAIYQWIMKRWPTYVDLLWEKRSATLSSDNEVYTYVAEYLADKAHLITNKLDPLDAMMFSCGKALFTLLTPWSWVIWRPKKKRFIIHDRVRTSVCIATYRDDGTSELDDQEQKPSLVFVPDDGSYTLMFEGVALDITVFQSESASVEGRSSRAESARRSGRYGGGEQPVGGKKKSFQITCEGSDSTCIKRFIQMAMDHYFDKHSGKIPIYTLDEGFYPEWRKSALRSPRALDTIVLRDGMLEDIIKDIRSFMSAERWYMEHGIPYRRGHILYGPPGTGKTSTIFAIASYFKMSVCLMNLSSSGMTDSTLQFLLTTAPKNSFIVFEDVDVAFPKSRLENDDEDTQGQSTVTVSGMLNAIDGIAAQEGRIIFLTTNAIESLPQLSSAPVGATVVSCLTTQTQP